jgi:hypothetical protein
MDALSDVLRAVRLTGAIFFEIRASEPWVAETPAGESIVGSIFPNTQHLIPYHVVTRGRCWGSAVDASPMQLSEGDIIVFPHGDAHVLSSAPGMRGSPDFGLYRPPSEGQLPFNISMGDALAGSAHIICGYLGCDARPFNPLLIALPRVIRVSERQGGAIEAFVAFALAESKEPRRPDQDGIATRGPGRLGSGDVERQTQAFGEQRGHWGAGGSGKPHHMPRR